MFVSAGDLIGATPLLSAAFHDEPTIEAFNMMELDYNGVGNHEFDEGVDELLRMQNGGCHPVDGCGDGDGFNGADFQFLAANVVYKKTRRAHLPALRDPPLPDGVKVAFIGMTLEGTPLIVSPGGIATVNFLDEAETVNALVPDAQGSGHRDDRRPAPRGGSSVEHRHQHPSLHRQLRAIPAVHCRRSSTRWTMRSTSSSPATPTGLSTA